MKTVRLLLSLAALACTQACRCTPPVVVNSPELVASPLALSFNACPSKDEAGHAVADISADRQMLTLTNNGKAQATLTLTFDGTGKDFFSTDATNTPMTVDALGSAEVPVLFAPTGKGDQKAQLIIDDADAETAVLNIGLTGAVINRPAQPTVAAAMQNNTTLTDFSTVCNIDSPAANCELAFADTLVKEASTLKIKLRNTGCPALKVTGIEVKQSTAGGGDLAYFLDVPAVTPSVGNPLVLSTADGTSEVELSIRFAPDVDASGITQRYADLVIKTNDPATPQMDILLSGNAIEPAVYASPTFCDFADPNDLCGNSTKVTNKAAFLIKNGGNGDITIDSTVFKSTGSATSGTSGRFTITGTPVAGTTIPAGGSKVLEVTHNEMPLYVVDTITVSASTGGQSAGRAILTVAGGLKPCLSTDPMDQLDFKNPTSTVTVKSLFIKNGAGAQCGELIINGVTADPSPQFALVDPLVAPGTHVAAGSQVEARVQYTKPVNGGSQFSVVRIDTNDLDYGPPALKVVRLYSQSPLDQAPTAVLTGCTPTNTACPTGGDVMNMTVHLSQLTPKTLTLSGKNSVDPGNSNPMPIRGYKFLLTNKPSNAAAAMLENNGVTITQDSVKLTLDPAAIGSYKVFLSVFDDSGQQSSPTQLLINVYQ